MIRLIKLWPVRRMLIYECYVCRNSNVSSHILTYPNLSDSLSSFMHVTVILFFVILLLPSFRDTLLNIFIEYLLRLYVYYSRCIQVFLIQTIHRKCSITWSLNYDIHITHPTQLMYSLLHLEPE